MFNFQFLCGTIKPIFKQFKCIALLNNEFKRRASFDCSAAKDDSAATSDKTAIVYVTVKSCIDNITTSSQPKYIVTVERFDESLNEFTTYITFRTDSGGSIIHLYGDKMFRINGCGDNFVSDTRSWYSIYCQMPKILSFIRRCSHLI